MQMCVSFVLNSHVKPLTWCSISVANRALGFRLKGAQYFDNAKEIIAHLINHIRYNREEILHV